MAQAVEIHITHQTLVRPLSSCASLSECSDVQSFCFCFCFLICEMEIWIVQLWAGNSIKESYYYYFNVISAYLPLSTKRLASLLICPCLDLFPPNFWPLIPGYSPLIAVWTWCLCLFSKEAGGLIASERHRAGVCPSGGQLESPGCSFGRAISSLPWDYHAPRPCHLPCSCPPSLLLPGFHLQQAPKHLCYAGHWVSTRHQVSQKLPSSGRRQA